MYQKLTDKLTSFRIINDFKSVDYTPKQSVNDYINGNTNLSYTYLLLLVCAVIICTLGLLINSAAVIIGGMIIAPLILPLIRLSYGLSAHRFSVIKSALVMLLISIIVTYFTAAIVTLLTPIRDVSTEIMARTAPTIIELFIALTVGVIASLATIHKRIGGAFAGVAIAISLVPPLCASAIGLTLSNYTVASGALLLFASNVIGIVVVATLIFSAFVYKNLVKSIFSRNFGYVLIVLVILCVPLYQQLRSSVQETQISRNAQKSILTDLETISPGARLQDYTPLIDLKHRNLVISAQAIVGPADVITYDEIKRIETNISNSTHFTTKLNLAFQNTAAIADTSSIAQLKTQQAIEHDIESLIKNSFSYGVTISRLNARYTKASDQWVAIVSLYVTDTSIISSQDITQFESELSKREKVSVKIDARLVQSVQLGSWSDLSDNITPRIIAAVTGVNPSATVLSVGDVLGKSKSTVVTLRLPRNQALSDAQTTDLRLKIQRLNSSSEPVVLKSILYDESQ
jgi:uncharacterized hydrophobic protein (TIGR00271 family)